MEYRYGTTALGVVMLAMVGFFLLFPGLKPDWIQIHVGKDKGRMPARVGGFYSRPTSWTPARTPAASPAPTAAEAAFDRGTMHLERGEWDQAIKEFSEVVRLEPKNGDAYFNRGVAKYNREQLDEAIADFDTTLRLNPKDTDALLARATVRMDQGRFEAALADAEAAVRISPDRADVYGIRGNVREEAGEYRLAVGDYTQGLRLTPDDPVLLNCLAWVLATAPEAGLRDGQRAVKAALRAAEIEEAKGWDTIDTLAAAFAETGNFEQAVRCQNEALRFAPTEEHDDIKSRLALYRAKKAYRLPGKSH